MVLSAWEKTWGRKVQDAVWRRELTARKWSAAFRALIRTDEVFSVIDDGPTAGGDWGAGGCWLLARAAQCAWGGRLWGLVNQRDVVDHVVWSADEWRPGLFLDDQGLRTQDVLEADPHVVSAPPGRLEPLVVAPEDAARTAAAGIASSAGTCTQVNALVAYFQLLPLPPT